MLNASLVNATSDSSDNFHKHQFIEIGTGYYTNFGSRFKFETFSGIGFGNLRAEYENSLWASRSDVNCTRFFLQPTIGVTSKVFDFGFSSRFIVISLKQESKSNTGFLFEPAVTAKLGWDHIKTVAQVGLSLPLNSEQIEFSYQPILISLGIQANFGKIFK